MNRNFTTRQAQTMEQLHSSRIVSNISHSHSISPSLETPIGNRKKDNKPSILKDTSNETTAQSHFRHFNTPNEPLDVMKEHRLET